MGIRIQPLDIDVPADNPFKNDLLDRKETVEVLAHLVGSIDGPCVIAVDSEWGSGKTTFLRILAQFLRNKAFPVVEFNAWETDFAGDPLVALSAELTDGLDEYFESETASVERLKVASKKLIRLAAPTALRAATGGFVDIDAILRHWHEDAESFAEARLRLYQEGKQFIEEFSNSLASMAVALSKGYEGRPLVVLIDELDRCRPPYAIELLEIAKHLFSADHVVFVLALNRDELAHSIKAVYGRDFDAQGYLRRFFDVDVMLPGPDREAFISALLDRTGFHDHFRGTQDLQGQNVWGVCQAMIVDYFGNSELSLRRVAQAIHRMGLVLASLANNQRSYAVAAVVALILRSIDPEIYRKFCRGQISDQDAIDRVRRGLEGARLRRMISASQFEAYVVAAGYAVAQTLGQATYESPLISHYKKVVDKQQKNSHPSLLDDAGKHAQSVVDLAEKLPTEFPYDIGFFVAAKRIELVSDELVSSSDAGYGSA